MIAQIDEMISFYSTLKEINRMHHVKSHISYDRYIDRSDLLIQVLSDLEELKKLAEKKK